MISGLAAMQIENHPQAQGQRWRGICPALHGPSYRTQLFKMTHELNWDQTYKQGLGV